MKWLNIIACVVGYMAVVIGAWGIHWTAGCLVGGVFLLFVSLWGNKHEPPDTISSG